MKPFTPMGDGMLGTAGAVMPGGVLPPGFRDGEGWRKRGGKKNKGEKRPTHGAPPPGSKGLGVHLEFTHRLNHILDHLHAWSDSTHPICVHPSRQSPDPTYLMKTSLTTDHSTLELQHIDYSQCL